MEPTKTNRRRRKTKRRDIPKLPIKTYKWEDVRRDRERGAYPWTHVTKPPFDEEVDPEEYTMDAFRRSRSSSTIGKSETTKSETQEFSETDDVEMKTDTEEQPLESHEEIPDIPHDGDDNQENIDPSSSSSTKVNPERPSSSLEKRSILKPTTPIQEIRAKSEEPKKKRKLSLESYTKINLPKLAIKDKLDKIKDAKGKLKISKLLKRSKSDVSDAKNKKPKLVKQAQGESTTTKAWLPPPPDKSPVYIHIPLKLPEGQTDEYSKLEFESPGPSSRSASLTQLQRIGSGRKMSLLGILTEIKKVHDLQHQKQLASESKKPSDVQSKMELEESTETTRTDDTASSDVEADRKPIIELAESFRSDKPELKKLNVGKDRVQRKDSDRLVIEEIVDEDRKSTKSDTKVKEDPIVDEPEDSSASDNVSQYLDKDDKCEIVEEKNSNASHAGPSKKEETEKVDAEQIRKLEATLSKWKKGPGAPAVGGTFKSPALSAFKVSAAAPQVSTKTDSIERPRAKSEEPKKKRKQSIDSSYSRKSLSKLAFMKRLREAKEKIKLPKFPSFPSFSKADKKDDKKPKKTKSKEVKKEESVPKVKSSKLEFKKSEEPLYIHIPLKLAPGQTDEFSHLAEETDNKEVVVKKEEKEKEEPGEKEETKKEEGEETESSVPTSPDVPPGVQFIILTPPSDDEILNPSVPETPSETDQKFFENMRMDELKNLAKLAVDDICPETKKLETVTEDEGSDEHSGPESSQEQLEGKAEESSEKKPILVDEEDGLKLSDAAIAMINEELAKELKEQETEKELKSSLKKKVSFKRKSRAEDGERIYEDVQLSSDPAKAVDDSQDKKLSPLESFQSMSVDEEKSYLDKKVIKETSLEDDYNKWSKLNDHEYEPVNPPPEGPPTTTVNTVDMQHQIQLCNLEKNKTASLDRRFVRIPPDEELVARGDESMDEPMETVQDAQKRIEDRFFTATPDTTTETELHTSQVDSSALETLPLKRENRKKTISTITTTTTTSSSATPPTPPTNKDESSIGKTLRTQADKIKTKLQGIKKPNIPKFPSTKLKKPEFKKPSFKKPNFKMPKMPETPSLNLPSFLTRKDSKDSSKDSWRNRQFSTESNAGDDSTTKKIFDFRTYPRIFKKNKEPSPARNDDRETTPPPPEFATVPRANRRTKGPVGSRWASKFKDIKYADEDARKSKEFETEDTQDVIRIPLHPDNEDPMDVPSHTRYNEDIDIEDDFEQENRGDVRRESPFINRDYLKRWDHGEFHGEPLHEFQYGQDMGRRDYRVTDLDNDMEETQTPLDGSFDIPSHGKEELSSGSLSDHRRGVLEEIDSDEFFLREKGISQDNIEVGKYLSSEIREAFRNPVTALSQLQSEDREYDLDVSDQSEPDAPRRKPLRKPRRKKTPHVSNEKVNYDQESVNTEPEEYPKPFEDYRTFPPPDRPKRRSKKCKKKPITVDVVPYQETIPIEDQLHADRITPEPSDILQDNNILADDLQFYNNTIQRMYENEHMKGIEQPDIKVTDPYYRYENFQQDIDKFLGRNDQQPPTAPVRKRSLKSLNASEHSSVVDEVIGKEIPRQNVEVYRAEQEYIIPTPEPPARPKRTRSRTHSQSGAEDDRTSRGADSLISDLQAEAGSEAPCIEEPCVQAICDTMGYAVIDKSKVHREPPLPPSRFPPSTPPRTRRAKKNTNKFSTVPRPSPSRDGPPVRPLRNYSTLGGSSRTSRTSRSKSPTSLHEGEKENIDLSRYIEIEDGESVRHLVSGEVIQKMRDRPLPAPPRPPRRPRGSTREVFRDISHERNIPQEGDDEKIQTEEIETATQTEPISPTQEALLGELEKQILSEEHEETVTHGALVVQPIDNAQILPYSQLHGTQQRVHGTPVERNIPVTRESTVSSDQQIHYSDEETSEIPEEFTKLKNPPPKPPQPKIYDDEETSEIPEEFTKLKNPPPRPPQPQQPQTKTQPTEQIQQEVGILKAQKMQVMDLDVDKLRVNELQANKIVVSELDGMSLQVAEINSKSGNLVISGIELPPHIIQEMLHKLQSSAQQEHSGGQSSESQTIKIEDTSTTQEADSSQKKTPTEGELPLDVVEEEEAPPVPPRYDSKTDLLEENEEECRFEPEAEHEEAIDAQPDTKTEEEPETIEMPPVRPPRKSSQAEKVLQGTDEPSPEELQVINDIQAESQESPPAAASAEEEVRKSPPRELPILPVEPPQSSSENVSKSEEEPPPRPPQPVIIQQQSADYIPSQPPASFYALKSPPPYGDFVEEDIPLPPRRKHHRKAPPVSRSSSEDAPPAPRRHHRSPEPSIPQLTGQLVNACSREADRSIKRLISHVTNNVLHNADGKQDLHVMILILLILIAGLILLSGDERVVIHQHHWEFFNPPRDL